jgi:hypothetical protein
MITLYGKRKGADMAIYRDKECTDFMCLLKDKYYRKNRVITINCWQYNLVVIK